MRGDRRDEVALPLLWALIITTQPRRRADGCERLPDDCASAAARDVHRKHYARAIGCRRLLGGIALIAIRHSEEAGELVNNHIGIHIYEEDTKQEADPVTKLQRSGTSFRSEAS